MAEDRLLIVSDKKTDLTLLKQLLEPKGYSVISTSRVNTMEERICKNSLSAIVADYGYVSELAPEWLAILEEKQSKACLILYGDDVNGAEISDIMQQGVYGFVPRRYLRERIADAIQGGLENRKAFMQILDMVDSVKEANDRLIHEQSLLESRNEALSIINRLSSQISYDRNWNRMLPCILDAGLLNVLRPEYLSILYRRESEWYLDVYGIDEHRDKKTANKILTQAALNASDFAGATIPESGVSTFMQPSSQAGSGSFSESAPDIWKFPIQIEELPLGMLTILPCKEDRNDPEKKKFMSTLVNILAMSLGNAQEYYNLRQMAIRDGLTGIMNRKGLMDFLEPEFKRARRYGKALSLMMIDIDNFKQINDTLGHQAGDYVLQELSKCLIKPLRQSDFVARYGGDEFAAMLPETSLQKAELLLERLLAVIQSHPFNWKSESITVEVSCGISDVSELTGMQTAIDLIALADSRLYDAKSYRNALYSKAVWQ